MQRRQFLARILKLAGLAAATPFSAAARPANASGFSASATAPVEATPSPDPIAPVADDVAVARTGAAAPLLLQSSAVAGFQYHQGEAVWPRLRPGAVLSLTREPHNRHDYRAIRVDWQGHKLGYVPRVENATLASLMDRGHPLEARITELREDRDPWRRVEMEIFLLETTPRG